MSSASPPSNSLLVYPATKRPASNQSNSSWTSEHTSPCKISDLSSIESDWHLLLAHCILQESGSESCSCGLHGGWRSSVGQVFLLIKRRFSDLIKKHQQLPGSPFGLGSHNWLQQFAQTGVLSLSGGYKKEEEAATGSINGSIYCAE